MTACENIDGHCGASWCDCEYQRKKQQSLRSGDLLAGENKNMNTKLEPPIIDNATMAMLTNLSLALTEAMKLAKAPPERMRQLESGDIAELYFWLLDKNAAPKPESTLTKQDADDIKTAIAEARERFPEHVTMQADCAELLLNSYLKNETVAEPAND